MIFIKRNDDYLV